MKLVIKFAFILFGFYFLSSPVYSQKNNLVTLQLKWKHQFQFAGYYAAIEKGYYKEYGIQLNLLEAVEGINPSDAVLEGKSEFGVCSTDIILMRSQNKKPVVLATIFQHSPLILLTLKQSGIEHVHDLVGKRIAMATNDADLIAYMNDEGVSPDSCKIDQHTFSLDGLINGKIDALAAFSTDEPFILNKANIDYQLISPLMGGIDFYGEVLFTSEELIKKNPLLVENFRKASIKGWKYAMDHPDEIAELIFNKYSKRHSLEHLKFESEKMKDYIMADVVEIGYSNPGRWEAISNTYKRLNLIDASFSTKNMLYSDFEKPKMNIPWNIIIFIIIAFLIIGSIAYFFYISSRKLRIEIANRLKIEKDLLESEEHYRIIFENNSAAMAIIEPDTTISMVNDAYCLMSGFTKQELIGISWTSQIPPQDLERLKEYNRLRQINPNDAPNKYEFTFYHKNGEIKHSMMSVTLFKPQNKIIVSFIDITDRRLAEQELKLKNEELQKVVTEKDKFFSIIAHDLRSPFSIFLGLTQIMAEELPDLKMNELELLVKNLNESATNLFRLLENLLHWSGIQQGTIPFNPENIHLLPAVDDSLVMVLEIAKKKDIEIVYNIPVNIKVYADNFILQTILRNLVSNAVKFTHKGGKIGISARYIDDKSVEISIKDTGIGMNNEIVENLFRIDIQTNRRGTEGEPSTGLGLMLCKELVQKNGGRIWVKSKEGKGSEFYFSLPCDAAIVD